MPTSWFVGMLLLQWSTVLYDRSREAPQKAIKWWTLVGNTKHWRSVGTENRKKHTSATVALRVRLRARPIYDYEHSKNLAWKLSRTRRL